jgi:hypothetical protein
MKTAARILLGGAVLSLAIVVVPEGIFAQSGHQSLHHSTRQALPSFTFGREGGNIRPYSITIDSTGMVHGAVPSSAVTKQVKLSKDVLNGLLTLATAEEFFNLPSILTPGTFVNPDIASLFITVHSSGAHKTVREHGTHNREFSQLFAILLAAAGTCDGSAQSCSG